MIVGYSQFLDVHEGAFEDFGGHTREHLYDRPRTVCQGTEQGRIISNPTFPRLAEYWGFEPRLCRPYRAQTKGKVESGAKYFKGNFLPGAVRGLRAKPGLARGGRIVADDWRVSVDTNRYSVPFLLIGQPVEVHRHNGRLRILHRGAVVAQHPELGGKHQVRILPEHGPGTSARTARRQHSTPAPARSTMSATVVEIRDLAVYDALLGDTDIAAPQPQRRS